MYCVAMLGTCKKAGKRGNQARCANTTGAPGRNDYPNYFACAGRLGDTHAGAWHVSHRQHNGIVVSSTYLNKQEPGTQLGDEIVLKMNGEEYTWRIVGISQEFMSPNSA